MKVNRKSLLFNISQYILAVVFILDMRSLYLYLDNNSLINNIILYGGYTALIGCIITKGLGIKRIKNGTYIIIGFAIFFVLFHLFSTFHSDVYFLNVEKCMIPIIYLTLCKEENDSLLDIICDLIYLIAIISLVFWIFGSIMGMIKPTGIVYSNWSGYSVKIPCNSYYGIYFETQKQDILSFAGLIRNTAIFAEAPMTSFIFSFSFIYQLFIKKTRSIYRIIVLILAIISTLSTTGFIVLILSFGMRYIFGKVKNRNASVIKVIITPTIITIAFILLMNFIQIKIDSFSGSSRLDDITAGFMAWKDSPLIGNGFNNVASIQKYMSSFRQYNLGYSISPLFVLACGGIYLMLPYLMTIYYSILNYIRQKQYLNLCYYLIFIYMFTITIVPYQMLVICILGWNIKRLMKNVI